jgi:hypothetical protein
VSKNSKRSVHTACVEYKVSYHKEHHGISLSLVDRGANGGVAGNDVRVIFKTNCTVDIKGIDNHCCTNINIGTVGGVIHTNKGRLIGIMHQYALLYKGSSIHSPCQFEWYKNYENDKSILVPGGLQRIQTLDGYMIPLSIQDGLTHLNIRPYTDQEFDTLPHIILTSELEWDPSVLDHIFKMDEQWGEAPTLKSQFNEVGDYTQRAILHHNTYCECQDGTTTDDIIDQCIYATHMFTTTTEHEGNIFYDAFQHEIAEAPTPAQATMPKITVKRSPDFQLLRPFFGWMSADIIQKTLNIPLSTHDFLPVLC